MIQLRRNIGFLLTSLSIGSFLIIGCNDQRNFGDTTTTTPPAEAPTTNGQNAAQANQASVPFVPTPNEVVEEMLEIANVTGDDVLYDLGSGDGRIVITAAQRYGTRGTGIEINPELVEQSRANAEEAGVADRVEFLQQDLFETDLSDATVVTLYLLPNVNLQLRPKLFEELEPGTRIVSHDFDMGEWEPERVEQIQGPVRQHTIYYWVVPEEVPENLTQ